MKISELYESGPLTGQDVFIIGTGPSMGVFPQSLLTGKTCILLNDAQKHFPALGPVAFANNLEFLDGCKLPYQCVKGRLKYPSKRSRSDDPTTDDNHCPWDDPARYVFSYRQPPWDKVSHHDESTLWQEPCHYWAPKGGSVSAFAVQFCLWSRCKSITVVGCDSAEVGGQEYVAGKKMNHMRRRYPQYAYGLTRLCREAHMRGVPMVSLTPFFGLGYHNQQFVEMNLWRR